MLQSIHCGDAVITTDNVIVILYLRTRRGFKVLMFMLSSLSMQRTEHATLPRVVRLCISYVSSHASQTGAFPLNFGVMYDSSLLLIAVTVQSPMML